ncbi:MAG: hypothetical protein ACKPKO_01935, partial [Candidatus Fonsibacter sp.]
MPEGSAPDPSGKVVSHLRRGPPCVPRIPEYVASQRLPNETDEEFKVHCTQLRYASVEGLAELECDMVDFCKQALSAQARGYLDTFTYHVLASRHWGTGHLESDSSLVTIQKTTRQFTSLNHLDYFHGVDRRSRFHHDLLHN